MTGDLDKSASEFHVGRVSRRVPSDRAAAGVHRDQIVSDDFDELDIRILNELQTDVTLPLAELARRVGSSKSVCWRRINGFLAEGIITERVAVLDASKVGYDVTAFVFAKIDGRKMQAFIAAILEIPEVVECHSLLGEVDILLKIVVPSIREYEAIWKKFANVPGMTQFHSSIALTRLLATSKIPLRIPKRRNQRGAKRPARR